MLYLHSITLTDAYVVPRHCTVLPLRRGEEGKPRPEWGGLLPFTKKSLLSSLTFQHDMIITILTKLPSLHVYLCGARVAGANKLESAFTVCGLIGLHDDDIHDTDCHW